MCDTDTPDLATVATMADSMSADAIVAYFREKGIMLQIVTDGIYPVGIAYERTTLFIPALQPRDSNAVP